MAMRDWNNNGDKNDFFDNMMDYKLYKHWKKGMEDKEKNKPSPPNKSGGTWLDVILTVIFVAIVGSIILGFNSLSDDIQFVIIFNLVCIPIAMILICTIIDKSIKSDKLGNRLAIILSILAAIIIFLFSLYKIDVFKNESHEHLKSEIRYNAYVFKDVFPNKSDILQDFGKYEIKSGDIKSKKHNQNIYFYVLNDKFDELTPKEMGKFFCELTYCTPYQDNSYLIDELWNKKKNIMYLFSGGHDDFWGDAVSEWDRNKFYYVGIKSKGNVYSSIQTYERCIVYKNYEPICIYDKHWDEAVLNGSPEDTDDPFEKYHSTNSNNYAYNSSSNKSINSNYNYKNNLLNSSKAVDSKYDVYGVYDYDDPEDFYYDNYDDFESYEDAEDYYDEAWDK